MQLRRRERRFVLRLRLTASVLCLRASFTSGETAISNSFVISNSVSPASSSAFVSTAAASTRHTEHIAVSDREHRVLPASSELSSALTRLLQYVLVTLPGVLPQRTRRISKLTAAQQAHSTVSRASSAAAACGCVSALLCCLVRMLQLYGCESPHDGQRVVHEVRVVAGEANRKAIVAAQCGQVALLQVDALGRHETGG